MDKARLRLKHLQLRKEAGADLLRQYSHRIFIKTQRYLESIETLAVYISKDDEVDTHELIQFALNKGIIVCVPKVIEQKMIFVQIHSLEECQLGAFGLLEPISSVPFTPAVDLQIIPMLAFNSLGYRLGYGKAYYDTYLKTYRGFKLGLCFQMNQEDELPVQDHDISCQIIITDAVIISAML